MNDMAWLHNEALKNINPQKMEVINHLVKETSGKPIAQSIPYLMKANKELSKKDLEFTPDETALIMEILTRDMTVAEKEQVKKMQKLINSQLKK